MNNDARLLPQTTYKDKRPLTDAERFSLNRELNDYLFGNCDHDHDGYPNHLACRACVLECFAAIAARVDTPAAPTGEVLAALTKACPVCNGPFDACDCSPLVVTRNGIPCKDQAAALEEFKQACTPAAPAERDKALAQQIVKKLCDATLELAFVRHDLTSDEVDVDEDADVKTRVAANEEFLERLKEDTLNCLTGDDIGCLDPEELAATNCELIWLSELLATVRTTERDRLLKVVATALDPTREGER